VVPRDLAFLRVGWHSVPLCGNGSHCAVIVFCKLLGNNRISASVMTASAYFLEKFSRISPFLHLQNS
jgi:hypothetical protein